jgi:hypothetical protein
VVQRTFSVGKRAPVSPYPRAGFSLAPLAGFFGFKPKTIITVSGVPFRGILAEPFLIRQWWVAGLGYLVG